MDTVMETVNESIHVPLHREMGVIFLPSHDVSNIDYY